MGVRLSTVLASLAALTVASSFARGESIRWLTSYDAAVAESKKTGKPLLIDFYADWCGYCKKLDREVYPNPAVTKTLQQVVAVRLDSERAGRPVAARMQVRGLPTILLVSPDGGILSRLDGYIPAADFNGFVSEVLRDYNDFVSCKQTLSKSPNDGAANAKIARIFAMRGNLPKAEEHFQRAQKAQFSGKSALLARAAGPLGDLELSAQKTDKSRSFYQLALDGETKETMRLNSMLGMSATYLSERKGSQAVPYLKKVLASKAASDRQKAMAQKLLAMAQRS